MLSLILAYPAQLSADDGNSNVSLLNTELPKAAQDKISALAETFAKTRTSNNDALSIIAKFAKNLSTLKIEFLLRKKDKALILKLPIILIFPPLRAYVNKPYRDFYSIYCKSP